MWQAMRYHLSKNFSAARKIVFKLHSDLGHIKLWRVFFFPLWTIRKDIDFFINDQSFFIVTFKYEAESLKFVPWSKMYLVELLEYIQEGSTYTQKSQI